MRVPRWIALVLGAVLVAVTLAGLVSVARSPERAAVEPELQTADEPSRATPGGGIERDHGHGPADRHEIPKLRVAAHPDELYLTRANGRVFDLRDLHGTVVVHERPEHEDPFERDGEESGEPAAELPASVSQSAIAAAAAAPAPGPDGSFDGLDFANWGAGHPPDPNGDVGPTYYIQVVNTSIGIYDKSSGARVAAFTFNAFMSQGSFGNLCDTNNFGDPVVLYDSFEDRWFVTDFAFKLDASGNVSPQTVFQCFAVSKTGDPVNGGWNFYSIQAPGGLDDYPKFGVWPDGIYMSANMFGYSASSSYISPHVWAIDKAQMYAGEPQVSVVDFAAPSSDFTLLPANARLQAGTPPAGSPEYFASTEVYLNALTIYKLHVDWDKVSTSTFTGPEVQLEPNCWPNASPANAATPANAADVLPIRAMAQNQYTNIGGAESLWISHTVQRGVSASNTNCNAPTGGNATVRWYQADITGGTVAANVVQGATFDPDGANTFSRFMPSLAVDRLGDMAIGYSKSNATTNPQIKYAGRLFGDPPNTLGQGEQTLINGTGAQSGSCGSSACVRWGDYSAMSLDPNGCTFWMTNEYFATTGLNDLTRIGSLHFPGCTTVGNGTLSGTVTDGTSPLAGVTVALGTRTTTTNAGGSYSFTVPAGTYPTETAAKAGFDPGTASSLVVPNGGTLAQNFTLGAAAQSGCFADNTQTAFQRGNPSSCDLVSSPGSVVLASPDNTDANNPNVSPSGFAFTNTSWAGQTFTPTVTGRLKRVDVELFCASCTSTGPNVTLSIRATTGATPVPTGPDLASATLAGFNDGGAGGLKTFTFASPVTLTAGTRYAFVFRSTAAFSGGTYAYTCSCSTTGFSDSNPYTNGQRVTSSTSGSTWAADTTVGGRDLNFVTYINPGYASSGTLVSSLKDANPAAGRTPTWTTLSFSATTPANTAVKLQVAASNTSFGPFNYVGPDGTAATFFTTSGASLHQFDGFRYLRYRAYLSTSDGSVTPTLSSVTVCFQDTSSTTATTLAVDPATGTYGGTTTLSATLKAGASGVGGESVTFTLDGTSLGGATTNAGGVATLSGVSLAGINAGSYPAGVAASFAGDATYAASSGSGSLTVAKADQAITITTHAPATAAANSSFTVAATGGGSGNPVTFGSAGACTNNGATFTINGPGVCTVKYDQAGNGNYNAAPELTESVNGQKADQAITIATHAPATAVYGTSFTVAATGGASGNPVTFSSSGACSNVGASFTMTGGTGTCTVLYDQAGNASYNPAPELTETVTAQKADQAITVTTHAPASAVYGTSFTVDANAPGGPVAFSASGGCSNVGPSFTMTSGTGGCKVKYDQAGSANYNAAPTVNESVTAQKADQSISFAQPTDRTYGDPDLDPAATASSGFAVSYAASGPCSIASGLVHLTGAGSCTVTASQAGSADFNAAPSVPRTFAVAAHPLTITASDQSKLYGQSLTLGTTAFTAVGLVGSDAVASVTLTSAGAAANAAVGTYPIVPSAAVAAAGTSLGNYAIAYANGTLSVRPAGVVGLTSLSVKPTGGVVDSFDSSLGPYGPSNKGSAAGVVSNGAVQISGVTISGDLRSTQSSVKIVRGSVVTGDVTAGTTVSNAGQVGGTVTQHAPSTALTAAAVATCSPFTGTAGLGGKFTYTASTGNLSVASGQSATLAAGTYCFHSVTLSSGSTLTVTGAVTLRVTGVLSAKGQLVNTTNVPASFRIESSYTGNSGVTLVGGSGAYLTLYAPGTPVALTSGAIFGSLLGKTLTVSGNGSIHVDVH